ncbi:MAG: nitrous oxide reductase family maturation protein NosD [Pirellulales bacterium]
MNWPLLIRCSLLLSTLAAARTGCGAGLDLHVSPSGKDAWTGRIEAPNARGSDGPLATIAGARDAIRRLRREQELDQTVVIHVRHGTYAIAQPIRFTSEDSGSPEHPIIYRAAGTERPVIHGGRIITGWRQEGSLWVADLPEVREGKWTFSSLWVDRQRRQPARTPNPTHPWGDDPTDRDTFRTEGPVVEPLNPGEKPAKSRTKFIYRDDDLPSAEQLDGAVLVVFHSWATSLMRVQDIDVEKHSVQFTGPARWPFCRWQADQRYFIEHLFEGLDMPGEWYLNRQTGKLYYWPLEGETIDKVEVVAPVARQLLVLAGEPAHQRYVEHLRFEGLVFRYTEFPIAAEGHSDAQAAFAVDAAVQATGARHCTLERCRVASTGNYGVWFRSGCQDNVLRHCEIDDLGAGGVRVGEGSSPSVEAEAALRNTIDNNFIHEGGRIFRSAVGVWIGRSSHNRVTHNEISHFRYTGVSVGWSWGYAPSSAHHNRIEWNHIHHIGLGQLNDMGAIYTLGVSPGTVLRGNHIHDVYSHPRLYGGWGLYTDEGSSQIELEGNLVYNTRSGSFHQHYGRDNRVVNNILALSQGPQIVRSREEDHNSFLFQRNIVYYDNGQLLGSTWKNGHWKMDQNCYWDASGRPVSFAGRSWDAWHAEGFDTHSIVADPRFEDPAAADFRLKADSPARKIGFVSLGIDKAGLYGEADWVERPKRRRE